MASSTRLRTDAVWGTALVLMLVGSWTSSAWAAKDPKEAEARSLFEQGQKDYDLGRFKEALDEYSKAYELKELPAFLFNIAQCHRQMHRWERASFFYKRYLDLSTGKPANTQITQDLIAECDQKQIEADKKRAADAEAARQLELAKIEAQKAESDAQAKRDEDARQQREEEERKAAALAATTLPPSAVPGPGLIEPLPVTVESPPVYKRWWFWTGVGVLATGAIVTTAYYGLTPSPTSLPNINAR